MSCKHILKICPVCDIKMESCFCALILGKYDVQYLLCKKCGLIQTEKPYWLDEAYKDAISILDTGVLSRNNSISKKLALLIFYLFGRHGKYLDSAGGYGLLTRNMRDIGFDFYWHDQFCTNIFAKGFEFEPSGQKYNAVTAFEVLEHIVDPIEFIKLNLLTANTDTMIFSTLLYRGEPPKPNQWWYYAHETGQHITFYNNKTLNAIADRLGMYISSNGYFHILSNKRINQAALKIILSPISEVLIFCVRLALGSRIMSDHSCLKKKII